MGRVDDIANDYAALAWPILTTFASLIPSRFGRLIRSDDINAEADPIG